MFIPIGDDNSRRHRTPFIVYMLVATNALAWFFQLRFGEAFTAAYAAIPFEITHARDLISTQHVTIHGQRFPIIQAQGPSPIYLTLISSMFMHGSWMHIIGNMVYLLIFGDQIEDRLGHAKFLLFYIAAGVAAALAQVASTPNSVIPTVGASGAIAGVLGAYLILHPKNMIKVLFIRSVVFVPAYVVLGIWMAMQVMGHLNSRTLQGPGVAYMAHLGGFAVGAVAALWMLRPTRRYR